MGKTLSERIADDEAIRKKQATIEYEMKRKK